MEKLQNSKVLLLGHGFTGSALSSHLRAGNQVTSVSRASKGTGPGHHVLDLSRNTSAHSLPALSQFSHIVVSIPPQQLAAQVKAEILEHAPRVTLLGSTGIYLRQPGQRTIITENAPLDAGNPRLPFEEALTERDGTVLRLAGIYGPGRNPRNWVTRGRIVDEPRQVNMIHVDDIVVALSCLLAQTDRPRVLNLADGQVHTWRDIIAFLRDSHALRAQPARTEHLRKPDSFIECTALLRQLPEFRPRDFWLALDQLCQDEPEPSAAPTGANPVR